MQKLVAGAAGQQEFTSRGHGGFLPLQRSPDKEAPKKADPKVEAPKVDEVKLSYPDCDPKPLPLDKVRAVPGATPTTFGFTSGSLFSGVDEIVYNGNYQCKFKVTSLPGLTFDPFVYTVENKKKTDTYAAGTVIPLEKPCLGKTLDKYVHITPETSQRIKAAEIEHCNDNHRAFDLTYGRYVAIMNALKDGFAGTDQQTCEATINSIFKDRSGINVSELPKKFSCLAAKTLNRDGNDPTSWHGVNLGEPKYSKDCKKATYAPDYTTVLPQVGKHPSSEVIKGCGVKD